MAEEGGDWRAALPLDYRMDDSLSKFKDIGSLVKSYKELEGFVSSTARLPKPDAKPEEWGTFYKAWGRPEKPDGYKIPELTDFKLEEQFQPAILSMAHELGLSQKQFEKLVGWGAEQTKGIQGLQTQAKQQKQAELKKKWGFAFDDKVKRAQKTIAMLAQYKADNPFVKFLEENGLDQEPTVLEFFLDVSQRLGEDNFVTEQQKTEATEKSEAEKKIRSIQSDPKHSYFDPTKPDHKDAVAEMSRLYAIAFPE